MKISEQWLREWVDPPVDAGRLAEQLTMAGLEVEGVTEKTPVFSDVVAARVESVAPHPEADNLSVCQVSTGSRSLQVVCGASNIREGMSAVLAPVGAVLPGDRTIQAGRIRGVASDGMLCSASELGLSDDAGGLIELPGDTKPGQALAELIPQHDHIIDISLTPNRGDCLSVAGIAREVSVINAIKTNLPKPENIPVKHMEQRQVHLEAPAACPRYVGRIINGIKPGRIAPLWLQERLERCGIRSINAVVDITNYVMLELGQPMHAFDNDLLEGDIRVRFAGQDESLTLLDGQECRFAGDVLLIADNQKPLAMAGIMGGLDTAVTGKSRNIFLESAFFDPASITGEARRYGLHTDSSHRFERGVDYTLQKKAIERATALILSICGGSAGPVTEASDTRHLPRQKKITLRKPQIPRLLGITIKDKAVVKILSALGMQVSEHKGNWEVIPPAWRFDVGIEADLIEELARIHGYDEIPGAIPLIPMHVQGHNHEYQQVQRIRECLVNRDYQEAITYSFVDQSLQGQITPATGALELVNPIASDMAVMRTSLLPGLIRALQFNIKRQQGRVRLFELGLVFSRDDKAVSQYPVIGGLIYGNIYEKQWHMEDIPGDFFDIKGDVEALLMLCGHEPASITYEAAEHPALHPGQCARASIDGQAVGLLGCLHPALQADLDLPRPVYVFELDFHRISIQNLRKYRKISKFPAVRRDLAILVDDEIPAARVMACIRQQAPESLVNLELFDLYQGEGIDLGKKSLALGLTFQGSSSTLTEAEVEAAKGDILARLEQELGATLRE